MGRDASKGDEVVGHAGKVVVAAPSPGIVVLRMSGNVTKDLVPPMVALVDKTFAAHPIATTYFYDLWGMTAYASEVRVDLTRWHLERRDKMKALHAVARSRLVRMGVSVANVALGNIVQHDDPSTFEAALRRLAGDRAPA